VAYHAELTLEPTLVLRSRPMHGVIVISQTIE